MAGTTRWQVFLKEFEESLQESLKKLFDKAEEDDTFLEEDEFLEKDDEYLLVDAIFNRMYPSKGGQQAYGQMTGVAGNAGQEEDGSRNRTYRQALEDEEFRYCNIFEETEIPALPVFDQMPSVACTLYPVTSSKELERHKKKSAAEGQLQASEIDNPDISLQNYGHQGADIGKESQRDAARRYTGSVALSHQHQLQLEVHDRIKHPASSEFPSLKKLPFFDHPSRELEVEDTAEEFEIERINVTCNTLIKDVHCDNGYSSRVFDKGKDLMWCISCSTECWHVGVDSKGSATQEGQGNEGRQMFDEMLERNAVSCISLPARYKHSGFQEDVHNLLDDMQGKDLNIVLDIVSTFSSRRDNQEDEVGAKERLIDIREAKLAYMAEALELQRQSVQPQSQFDLLVSQASTLIQGRRAQVVATTAVNGQLNALDEKLSARNLEMKVVLGKIASNAQKLALHHSGNENGSYLAYSDFHPYSVGDLACIKELNQGVTKQFDEGPLRFVAEEERSKYSWVSLDDITNCLIRGNFEKSGHHRVTEMQRLRSICATSERQWVEAQVENAKPQAILSMLKSQVASDGAYIHRDIHFLRRKPSELLGELSNLQQLVHLQETYTLQGDYDLKIMRQEYYINQEKTYINQPARHLFLKIACQLERKTALGAYSRFRVVESELQGYLLTTNCRLDHCLSLIQAALPTYVSTHCIVKQISGLQSDLSSLQLELGNSFPKDRRRYINELFNLIQSFEQLLDKIVTVQSRSDGVCKIQFIDDLPIRLGRGIEAEACEDAVRFLTGAKSISKTYGDTSFQNCKIALVKAIDVVRLYSDSEPIEAGAEAVMILKKLNSTVDSLKSRFLENLEKGLVEYQNKTGEMEALESNKNELSKTEDLADSVPSTLPLATTWKAFIGVFLKTVSASLLIFSDSESRFREIAQKLFTKRYDTFRKI